MGGWKALVWTEARGDTSPVYRHLSCRSRYFAMCVLMRRTSMFVFSLRIRVYALFQRTLGQVRSGTNMSWRRRGRGKLKVRDREIIPNKVNTTSPIVCVRLKSLDLLKPFAYTRRSCCLSSIRVNRKEIGEGRGSPFKSRVLDENEKGRGCGWVVLYQWEGVCVSLSCCLVL